MSLLSLHTGVVYDEPVVLRYHEQVTQSLVLEQATCSRCKPVGQASDDSQNVAVLASLLFTLIAPARPGVQWHLCMTVSIGQHCSMTVHAIAGFAL